MDLSYSFFRGELWGPKEEKEEEKKRRGGGGTDFKAGGLKKKENFSSFFARNIRGKKQVVVFVRKNSGHP